MNAMLGLLVPALVGVDFGWQRRPNDTIEYIVQVDPETFAEMQATGRSIGSALPANLRSRIGELTFRVGREPLPNQNTLPPETNEPRLIDAAGAEAQPIQQTSGYQPPGSPGGDTTWASQATSARWPSSPTNVPTTSPGTTTSAWPSSAATRYGDNASQPVSPTSTSGFPINPTAAPPTTTNSGTNTAFPGSALGTLPPSSTVPTPTNSSAWPTTTAPPSFSSGPRIVQPSPWQAQPREVSITARMPAETTSTANAAATPPPNYGYPPPQQPPHYYAPPQPQQYAQAGYPPQAMPQPGVQPQPAQPQPYPPPAGTAVAPREPASPSPAAPAAATSESNGLTWALALIGLLTSLACNFYFGWSNFQIRERYRLLLVDRNAYST